MPQNAKIIALAYFVQVHSTMERTEAVVIIVELNSDALEDFVAEPERSRESHSACETLRVITLPRNCRVRR